MKNINIYFTYPGNRKKLISNQRNIESYLFVDTIEKLWPTILIYFSHHHGAPTA